MQHYGTARSTGHGHRPCTYAWKPCIYRPVYDHRTRANGRGRKGQSHAKHLTPPERLADNFGRMLHRFLALDSQHIHVGYQAYLDFGHTLFRLGLSVIAIVLFSGVFAVAELIYINSGKKTKKRINIQRKTSVNPPPDPKDVLKAWEAVRKTRRNDPEGLVARLRLGALLADIEPVVDQTYIRDTDGTIVGRRPGLKGWIGLHCPTLVPHYKVLMSYKALAAKLCESLHVNEPDTIDNVINISENNPTKILVLRESLTVAASNEAEVRKAYEELFGGGVPKTATALEGLLRLYLGRVRMQRTRKRRRAA